jgi:hypothetical protein
MLVRGARWPRRDRTGDERPAPEPVADLVCLAACAEPCCGGEECECRDEPAQGFADRVQTGGVRDARCCEEDRSDEVGEAWRPGVFELTLSEMRLDEFEVGETGDTEAAAKRKSDPELCGEDSEQPPPAGRDGQRGECADRGLVEARRARVDDVEVAVGVGEPLHFAKYCCLGSNCAGLTLASVLSPEARPQRRASATSKNARQADACFTSSPTEAAPAATAPELLRTSA